MAGNVGGGAEGSMIGGEMSKGLDDGTLMMTGDLVSLGGHANAPEIGELSLYPSSTNGGRTRTIARSLQGARAGES